MLKLDIKNEYIRIKSIEPEKLPEVLGMYNKTEEFKYATGYDKPVTLKFLCHKYQEAAICKDELFAGIYGGRNGLLIGVIKGRIRRFKEPAFWINSVIIDTPFQKKGLGREVITFLLSYLKLNHNIKKVYAAVVQDNTAGMNFWIRMGFVPVRIMSKQITLGNKKHYIAILWKNTHPI